MGDRILFDFVAAEAICRAGRQEALRHIEQSVCRVIRLHHERGRLGERREDDRIRRLGECAAPENAVDICENAGGLRIPATALSAQTVEYAVQSGRRKFGAQLIGRDFFEIVSLIENQPRIRRQDRAGPACGLRQHECMIDYKERGLHRFLASPVHEAPRIETAMARRALLARACEQTPGQTVVCIKIAIRGRAQPFNKAGYRLLLGFVLHPKTGFEKLVHRPQAEIVAAALEQCDLELPRTFAKCQHGARYVVAEKLRLEIARRRGDDNACIVEVRPKDGRYQIRERLPHPRPGLDHQMLAGVERPDDRLEHVDLAGSLLVARHGAESAADAKMHRRVIKRQRRTVLMRDDSPAAGRILHFRQEVRPVRVVHEFRRGQGEDEL